jgi:Na+-driven multidrug efflux pump
LTTQTIISRFQQVLQDKDYFHLMWKYSLPIALQNLVVSSLTLVAGVMIGQLGEKSVAAVGQANQVLFLLNLIVFGVVSGAAMFLAQLWGKKDISNIRRVLGLTVKLSLVIATIFWALGFFFPVQILSIYSNDPQVIQLGSQYLRIACWGYFFLGITAAFAVALRSIGNVRLPLVVSTSALGFNIALAALLIFGWDKVNIPAMGVEGAAIAGLVARLLECLALLILIYRDPI